jgi:hypothetical protein
MPLIAVLVGFAVVVKIGLIEALERLVNGAFSGRDGGIVFGEPSHDLRGWLARPKCSGYSQYITAGRNRDMPPPDGGAKCDANGSHWAADAVDRGPAFERSVCAVAARRAATAPATNVQPRLLLPLRALWHLAAKNAADSIG